MHRGEFSLLKGARFRALKNLVSTGILLVTLMLNQLVSAQPSIVVNGSGGNVCVGQTQTFNFAGPSCTVNWFVTTNPANYTIVSSNNNNFTITWNQPVTGVSVGAGYSGCSSNYPGGSVYTASFNVGASLPNSVSISGPSSVCANTSGAIYTASNLRGVSSPQYQWKVNGAPQQTGTSNVFTRTGFNNNDIVTAAIVNNAAGCLAPSNEIKVNVALSVSITQDGPPFCSTRLNNGAGFNIVGSAQNGTYTWYKNNSVVHDNTAGVSYAYVPSGAMATGDQVKCVLTSNASGVCTAGVTTTSNTLTVTVAQPKTPGVIISTQSVPLPGSVCAGTNLTFTAAPPTGEVYTLSNFQWQLDNLPGVASNAFSTTEYTSTSILRITATASGGCLSTTTASASTQGWPISVLTRPNAAISDPAPGGKVTLCVTPDCQNEKQHTINASPIGSSPQGLNYTYVWQKDNVMIPGATGSTYQANTAGIYKVTVSNGTCSQLSSNSLQIIRNIPPTINAGPDIQLIMPQNSTAISATASDPDGTITSYSWSIQSVPEVFGYTISGFGSRTLQLANLTTGTYVFRLTVTDNNSDTASDDVTVTVSYPPNNYNQVRETVVLVKDQHTLADVAALSIADKQKNVTISYVDGLGRSMQTVDMQASPINKNDMITPVVYDIFGRQALAYLPVTTSQNNGYYLDNVSIIDAVTQNYTGTAANVYSDARPFSETQFEPSPLNRPLKQYGPGNDWKTKDRSVVCQYLINTHGTGASLDAEKTVAWQINTGSLPIRSAPLTGYIEAGGYYSSNQLSIKSTKDEQGNEVREYTNKQGQVILKKVQAKTPVTSLNDNTQWALTYYIYDDFGRLRFVLQPTLSAQVLASDTYAPVQTDLDALSFQYQYDERGRMIQKQVPGAKPIYMIYDNRDRLVMMQDGNQRTSNQWTVNKYDALNRPVMTGIYTHPSSVIPDVMKTLISTTAFAETFNGDASNYGYTNSVFPTTNVDALTITYYDNYNFRTLFTNNNSFDYRINELVINGDQIGQEPYENRNVTGQVTGTKTRMITAGSWLKTVNYYDGEYRLIQQIADNIKGHSITTTTYDFVGKPMRTKTSLYTGQPVTWDTSTGRLLGAPTLSGNNISFTGSGADWTQGAVSVQALPVNTDGWIEATLSQVNAGFMLGLGHASVPSYNNIDFAWYVGTTQLNIRKNGNTPSYGGAFGNVQSGDVLRIERINGKIYYKKNGIVIYPMPGTLPANIDQSNAQLYFYITLRAAGSKVSNVVLSNTFSIPAALAPVSSVTKRMTYDHAGRLIDTWHRTGRLVNETFSETAEILLSHNTYNELGQLVDRKLHSSMPDASDAKQSIDYRYNIRGWLTSINNAELSGTGTNDDSGDLFGMNLAYNDDMGTGNTANAQYNGNINAVKWSTGLGLGAVKEMAYNFTYDAMNRLANAYHQQATTVNVWSPGQYDESGFSYDLNGNIMTLQRKGSGGGIIDKLTYTYTTATGNQLQAVKDDATSANDKPKGFYDGYTGNGEYVYDLNGNLTIDRNKNLIQNGANPQAIFYNYLNLPEKIYKYGNDNIVYLYDAAGVKHAQVITQGGTQKTTEYVGPWIFENNVLQFVQHDEGRVIIAREQLLYGNACDIVTTDMQTDNATLSTQTINGEKYVKVTATSSPAAVKGGLKFGKVYSVAEGERYLFRVKGYFNGAFVTLYVNGNGSDLLWPGTSLPRQPISESWVEQIILVPNGITQITLGILWNGAATTTDNFLINEVEFYKLDNNTVPEYQYHLKDHLGNVRVTFTASPGVDTSIGTMEATNQSTERSQFLRYDNQRLVNNIMFDHTNDGAGTTGNAIRLSGSANEKTGLEKSLSVMPGDVIDMEVYAKYIDTNHANLTTALNTLITQIANGTAPAGTVTDGSAYSTNSSNPFSFTGLNGTGSSTGSGPKAYLNYLVFDRDFNLITAQCGYQRLSAMPKEDGQNVAHEKLSASITIAQAGYVYIYLSNEETTPVEVFFDDFTVTQVKSPVVQSDNYYPFGLKFNSYSRENSVPNKTKLFQRQEHIDDLGLNWDSFKWRNHQPDIGRFFGVDKLAEKYYYNSPYAFSENKVVAHVELEGLESASSALVWSSTNYGTDVSTKQIYENTAKGTVDGIRVSTPLVIATALTGNPELAIPFMVTSITGFPTTPSPQAMETTVASEVSAEVANITKNAQKGAEFEKNVVANLEKSGHKNISQQVTVKAENGIKTRVDILSKDASGKVRLTEAKSSQSAPLTKNQKSAFPSIEQNGGTVVGKGKPGFEGGTIIPPTKIDIVRPNQ